MSFHQRFAAMLVLGTLLIATGVFAAERVSINSSNEEGNGFSSRSDVSADGRFVVFSSHATNLVSDDNNGRFDIFVRDRWEGTTERVSISSEGTEANSGSSYPAISGDGRYVVFQSTATNFDGAGGHGIFVRDRQAGTTTRVSVNSDGIPANRSSKEPDISRDGRYVVFHSQADNLVPNPTNGYEVYIHDRETGENELISVNLSGQGNGGSSMASVSADGRFVAFISVQGGLVANDTNYTDDVFVRDRLEGITERVSVGPGNEEGNGPSIRPEISDHGRYVAFSSQATNLVEGGNPANGQIFVHDREQQITELITVACPECEGDYADSLSREWAISGNGRYVAFSSTAGNLVPEPGTGFTTHVFVRDRVAQLTTLISTDFTGQYTANDYSEFVVISTDGRHVAFNSTASNLVEWDTNNTSDVFITDRGVTNQSPTCDLVSLAAITSLLDLELQWSGTDPDGIVDSYSLFMSVDGGEFLPVVVDAPETSAVVAVEPGMEYGFYCIAVDNAGSSESQFPEVAETTTVIDRPPVADAGLDVFLECESTAGATVALDGSGSSDPDLPPVSDDSISFDWMLDPGVAGESYLGDTSVVSAELPLGSHTATLTVTDSYGLFDQDTVQAVVQDTEAPALVPPTAGIYECDGNLQACITLAPATATDACCDTAELVNDFTSAGPDASGCYPLGDTDVTFTGTDCVGNGASATSTVSVVDTTDPVVSLSTTEIVEQLPTASATGVYVNVAGVATVADTCDPSPTLANDAPAEFPVGSTIVTFTATDSTGNTGQGELQVRVLYTFGGFLPPLKADGSSIIKSGRVVPLKFALFAQDGSVVSNAVATLQVFKITDVILGTTEEQTVEAAGNANTDNFFRFDPSGGIYIYNLDAGYSKGTYLARVTPNDGTTQEIQFSVK